MNKQMLIAAAFALGSSAPAMATTHIDMMFPAPVDGKLTVKMNQLIKDFNQMHSDIKVRPIFTGSYDTTKQKAEAAAKAGRPPALVIMSANYTTDLAINHEILPMSELFQYGPDKNATAFLKENFFKAVQKNAMFNGKAYAMPFQNSTPILYFNKDLFKKAGIQGAPQTWKELREDARKLTSRQNGQWGIMLPSTNNDYCAWVLSSLVHANGGNFNNPDYPGEVYYNSVTTIGALDLYKDLIFKDKSMPEGVLDSKQIDAQFLSGKLGMTILSTGSLTFIRNHAKSFHLGVAMLPKKFRRGVIIGGASLVSFKGISDAQKKAAYQLLRYLTSPKINGEWSRFTGYFAPRKKAYDLPKMKQFLAKHPSAKVAFEQLKYAYPWYSTYETVAVRQAMENQVAALISNKDLSPAEVAATAQKNADKILAPYQRETALNQQ
ncbi:sn-glycerol 3-phosphate transport system substrate-binding protein [Celerinatantimonas diazotrophica]|uniref:sn-glycerol 3-phosphate transport system substrate-binding protein n=2 Tax=Celerinatantimonas diazotrophica TaxID=412034 RepID=A0A4R1J8S4_9GAMM|nr:ABC transporter substrate-binding protein [Celerinatantimonas diazotrophica]TCK46446.1 sn-glycerol 3-phosphate transport system substrate-binding protein [Celerinatantimonas diazotrophica]CAG9295177.1 sn-glycerol-3-phosphate-binding periplasmic protein UgpB [Celerinatantimonas diazotrophica]